MEVEEDFNSLPLPERIESDKWKARVSGYNELIKLFTETEEDTSSVFNQYAVSIKKIIYDKNVLAQEKGMEAILIWADRAPAAVKNPGTLCDDLIEKCLAARQKTSLCAQNILLLLIERECQEPVVASLIQGISNKVPKIAAASIQTLRLALSEFGPKVVNIKAILKALPQLFDHTDKKVREEAVEITLEVYRYIGIEPIRVTVEALRSAQSKEIFDRCEKEPTKKIPSRFLRSAVFQPTIEKEEQSEPDPFEYVEAKDILSQLDEEFYTHLHSKIWKERKEKIDFLASITNIPKIKPGDYSTLARSIVNMIANDTNIMVVSKAIDVAAYLANGLRKEFSPSSRNLYPVLIAKFKEKKQFVLTSIHSALDNIIKYCLPFTDLVEVIVTEVTTNKIPNVRLETLKFVLRAIKEKNTQSLSKETIKTIVRMLMTSLDDSVGEVRDISAEIFGQLTGIVGERVMQPYFSKLDSVKLKKVKDFVPETSAANLAAPINLEELNLPKALFEKSANVARKENIPNQKVGASSAPTKPLGRSTSKAALADSKKENDASSSTSYPSLIGEEEALSRASEILGEETQKELSNAKWQIRFETMEKVMSIIDELIENGTLAKSSDVLLRQLITKPGFKEANFTIMNKMLDVISKIFKETPKPSKAAADIIIAAAVDKIGDIKLRNSAANCLTSISEAISLKFVLDHVIKVSSTHKNPKVLLESVQWISTSIVEFGVNSLQLTPLIDYAKLAYNSSNSSVRSATTGLVSTLRIYVGPSLRDFFSDLKPSLLSTIDAQFEKVAQSKPSDPVRFSREAVNNNSKGKSSASNNNNNGFTIPRQDISKSITPSLIEKLNAKDWQTRKQGLCDIQSIIDSANHKICPTVGNLFFVLRDRFNDANAKLVIQSLNLVSEITKAMGSPIDRHLRNFLPNIFQCLGDNKKVVATAAAQTIQLIIDEVGIKAMIDYFPVALENVLSRKEALTLLTQNFGSLENADVKCLVKPAITCLQDKASDSRKMALTLTEELVNRAGYNEVISKTKDLKPTILSAILPLIEKLKPHSSSQHATKLFEGSRSQSSHSLSTKSTNNNSTSDDSLIPSKRKNPEVDELPSKKFKPSGIEYSVGASKLLINYIPSAGSSANDPSPFLLDDRKSLRSLEERNFKWFTNHMNFTTFHIDILQSQAKPSVKSDFFAKLFSSISSTKLQVINEFNKSLDLFPNQVLASLDLIFKWSSLIILSDEVILLKNLVLFLLNLSQFLDRKKYLLSDYEADLLLPILVDNFDKLSSYQDNSGANLSTFFINISKVYPASKVFQYLLFALHSKDSDDTLNTQNVFKVLQLISQFFNKFGIDVCSNIPVFFYHLLDLSKTKELFLTNEIQTIINILHTIMGNEIWKFISALPNDKQQIFREDFSLHQIQSTQLVDRPKALPSSVSAPSLHSVPALSSNSSPVPAVTPVDSQPSIKPSSSSSSSSSAMEISSNPTPQPASAPAVVAPSQAAPTVAPSSPSSRSEMQNSALNNLFDILNDNEENECVEALKIFCKMMEENHLPPSQADFIFQNITQTTKKIFFASPISLRFCKYLIHTWGVIFTNRQFVSAVSANPLRDIVEIMLLQLQNPNLQQDQQGTQLLNVLNKLVISILDQSNRNLIFQVLLQLLYRSVNQFAADGSKSKFIDFVLRCLLKLAKTLGATINTFDIGAFLLQIHYYFQNAKDVPHPGSPHKTVKAILKELVKRQGPSILDIWISVSTSFDGRYMYTLMSQMLQS